MARSKHGADHCIVQGSDRDPKKIRESLNLEGGTKVTIEVRGHEIVLSKEPAWKKLEGMISRDLMPEFAEFRKRECELEDRGFAEFRKREREIEDAGA